MNSMNSKSRRYELRDAWTTEEVVQFKAYEKPPERIKAVYKTFQKLERTALEHHLDLIDTSETGHSLDARMRLTRTMELPAELRHAFADFLGSDEAKFSPAVEDVKPVYEATSIPGLFIYPSLIIPEVQLRLLNRLFHRDLSNLQHKTNVHLHYNVPYPSEDDSSSFFDSSSSNLSFQPKDPSLHKPITTQQVLQSKLRWMTLGGQYDWTNKVYPSEEPPPFPPDIKQLVEDIFPMKAEAAIVNLYSPNDTLSLHRDVSEECSEPLVSISLGCDGIFVIGLDDVDVEGKPRIATVRLRSGDAVLMSGASRYAWHGVSKVLESTCPEWMANWPCRETVDSDGEQVERFEEWREWMRRRRINVNVRQMFETAR